MCTGWLGYVILRKPNWCDGVDDKLYKTQYLQPIIKSENDIEDFIAECSVLGNLYDRQSVGCGNGEHMTVVSSPVSKESGGG